MEAAARFESVSTRTRTRLIDSNASRRMKELGDQQAAELTVEKKDLSDCLGRLTRCKRLIFKLGANKKNKNARTDLQERRPENFHLQFPLEININPNKIHSLT